MSQPGRPPTTSRLATPVAQAILSAFVAHRESFRRLTRAARGSFENRDWARLRIDHATRLGMYRVSVDGAEAATRALLGERADDRLVWVSAKAVYSALISQRQDWDLAETFFNGVTRRLFRTVGVDPLVEFVASDFDAPPSDADRPAYRRYVGTEIKELIAGCLLDVALQRPWIDRAREVGLATARVEPHLAAIGRGPPVALEVIDSLFYRGRGAYLVGRWVFKAGVVSPMVLAIRNLEEGLVVDAVLLEESDVSILFSFTHSYFHVDAARPYDVMRFLRSLIPKKRIAELYIALGEPKQGKTELYRAVMDHIDDTEHRFGLAAGTPGLVMVVFTMPGLDVVVKLIRDHFPPEKSTSVEKVRERYEWVYRHDRAGRLVDAQEYEHLAFDRARFEPALLEELAKECKRTVEITSDRVVVHFAYLTRHVTPLNLYLRQRSQEEAEAAIREWGQAIRDLASENVFPGDLLLKNFGVTRHGRVALYDYDELMELTQMNFRDLPEPVFEEDETRGAPWFAVGAYDVFPEEFSRFLGVPARLKEAFMRECKHVFDPAFWRAAQRDNARGRIVEVLPYREERRLTHSTPGTAASGTLVR